MIPANCAVVPRLPDACPKVADQLLREAISGRFGKRADNFGQVGRRIGQILTNVGAWSHVGQSWPRIDRGRPKLAGICQRLPPKSGQRSAKIWPNLAKFGRDWLNVAPTRQKSPPGAILRQLLDNMLALLQQLRSWPRWPGVTFRGVWRATVFWLLLPCALPRNSRFCFFLGGTPTCTCVTSDACAHRSPHMAACKGRACLVSHPNSSNPVRDFRRLDPLC